MFAFTEIARFFQEGGTFMVPIALVGAIGIGLALERALTLTRAAHGNRRDLGEMLGLLKGGRLREVQAHAETRGSAVARIWAAGLARLPGTRRRQDVEWAMEEELLEALPAIERRTPYLATLANIATLLGLLGTIIGLIAAFTAVADADPAEKASMLSASISVAMNTTAFGLMTAIPLLLIHAWLSSRTTALVEGLEASVVKFLNTLERRHAWAGAAADGAADTVSGAGASSTARAA